MSYTYQLMAIAAMMGVQPVYMTSDTYSFLQAKYINTGMSRIRAAINSGASQYCLAKTQQKILYDMITNN